MYAVVNKKGTFTGTVYDKITNEISNFHTSNKQRLIIVEQAPENLARDESGNVDWMNPYYGELNNDDIKRTKDGVAKAMITATNVLMTIDVSEMLSEDELTEVKTFRKELFNSLKPEATPKHIIPSNTLKQIAEKYGAILNDTLFE